MKEFLVLSLKKVSKFICSYLRHQNNSLFQERDLTFSCFYINAEIKLSMHCISTNSIENKEKIQPFLKCSIKYQIILFYLVIKN